MNYSFVDSAHGFPSNAVMAGIQNDEAGKHWAAVANTPYGPIGGKAKGGTCWYPFDGEENTTEDFSWLTAPAGSVKKVNNCGTGPPPGAISYGQQNDDNREYFAAQADSVWGKIPGKARDNTCWYPYDGKEFTTSDFSWLTTKK
ncbi:uncharacterized protein LOC124139592 [Haliotis rufescens]|uniref:uncharacterized protein LOC124139592 n=1 Tax=Haliotis rufescens TaxID=6454 RepID=UPI001EAF903A|nr:uncharacterized protein LOC124139592 [Haliotis rufescens]